MVKLRGDFHGEACDCRHAASIRLGAAIRADEPKGRGHAARERHYQARRAVVATTCEMRSTTSALAAPSPAKPSCRTRTPSQSPIPERSTHANRVVDGDEARLSITLAPNYLTVAGDLFFHNPGKSGTVA
jgi:hypothetical protein